MKRTQPGQQLVNIGRPLARRSGRRSRSSLPSSMMVRSAEKSVLKM